MHISEIDWKRIAKMDGIFKEGDIVKVKLVEVDKKTGKLRLSRKALLPKPPEENKESKAHARPQKVSAEISELLSV